MNISSSAGLLPLTSITWWCLSFLLCLLFFLHLSHPLLLDVASKWIFMYRMCVCCLWTHLDSLPLGPIKEMMLTSCSVICGPGSLFMAQVYLLHTHVCVCEYPCSRCSCRRLFDFIILLYRLYEELLQGFQPFEKIASLWLPLLRLVQWEVSWRYLVGRMFYIPLGGSLGTIRLCLAGTTVFW